VAQALRLRAVAPVVMAGRVGRADPDRADRAAARGPEIEAAIAAVPGAAQAAAVQVADRRRPRSAMRSRERSSAE